MTDSFQDVLPTAYTSAYPKTLTDIRYAKEIYAVAQKSSQALPLVDRLAPELEARHKLIDKLLDEQDVVQIVELAAGFGARGTYMTKQGYNYVEVDLAAMIQLKKEALQAAGLADERLAFVAGSVTDSRTFEKCKRRLVEGSVAVINEGLMRYLDFNEKRTVAKHIHALLNTHGGVWITCDVTPRAFADNQNSNLKNFNQDLTGVTARNNANWRFSSRQHVRDFMDKVGFRVEFHDFDEVINELTSPSVIGLTDQETRSLLKDGIVAVMKVKR